MTKQALGKTFPTINIDQDSRIGKKGMEIDMDQLK